jgi:hypothetical protein
VSIRRPHLPTNLVPTSTHSAMNPLANKLNAPPVGHAAM